jgi:hypothetical protein
LARQGLTISWLSHFPRGLQGAALKLTISGSQGLRGVAASRREIGWLAIGTLGCTSRVDPRTRLWWSVRSAVKDGWGRHRAESGPVSASRAGAGPRPAGGGGGGQGREGVTSRISNYSRGITGTAANYRLLLSHLSPAAQAPAAIHAFPPHQTRPAYPNRQPLRRSFVKVLLWGQLWRKGTKEPREKGTSGGLP